MSALMDEATLALDAEEQARANVYALLSRLFAAPADADLLRGMANGKETGDGGREEGAGDFAEAWRDLSQAAGDARASEVADEYATLFVGTGRSEVSLYVGAYATNSSVDNLLVALRGFLASHGLQRRDGVHEPEDHFAMLFEIMRFLISGQNVEIEEQKRFFEQFIWPGGVTLCDAICNHPRAHFYQSVALATKRFLFVEHDAFAM